MEETAVLKTENIEVKKTDEGFVMISKEKEFPIKGIAVTPGLSRNGIMYTIKELKKFAKTMVNVPILRDHVNETLNAIGVVNQGKWSDAKEGVVYEGWIKDHATQERIEDGRIKNVSIGAIIGQLVEEKDDDNGEFLLAKGMTSVELSTTPVPGVVGTSIGQALKKFNKGEKLKKPIIENFGIENLDVLFSKEKNSIKESFDFDADEFVRKEMEAEKQIGKNRDEEFSKEKVNINIKLGGKI